MELVLGVVALGGLFALFVILPTHFRRRHIYRGPRTFGTASSIKWGDEKEEK